MTRCRHPPGRRVRAASAPHVPCVARAFFVRLAFALAVIRAGDARFAHVAGAAQSFTYNPLPPRPTPPPARSKDDGQMLVQAQEVNYDNVNSLVAAVGTVQIYYNGTTLEADRVTYNQKTKRLTPTATCG